MTEPTRYKIQCPYCGYKMPIQYSAGASQCYGVYVKCKGRNCGKEFEIIIKKDK